MFDPTVGRWLSEDPIRWDAEDVNLQRYVGNDPTNKTDPSGLEQLPYSAKEVEKNIHDLGEYTKSRNRSTLKKQFMQWYEAEKKEGLDWLRDLPVPPNELQFETIKVPLPGASGGGRRDVLPVPTYEVKKVPILPRG